MLLNIGRNLRKNSENTSREREREKELFYFIVLLCFELERPTGPTKTKIRENYAHNSKSMSLSFL